MKLNPFEQNIVHAIGKHYPVILQVIDILEVKSRSNTGSGMFIDFVPIIQPLESPIQLLDLHGIIHIGQVELGAHIEMDDGIPKFMEICCYSWEGWDGAYEKYSIKN